LRAGLVADLAAAGVNLTHPAPLFAATLVLSNVVSNVPAVMLLLPVAAHALAGPTLALVSTLAGNLLIVGSIANIIVVDAAARRGIRIDWRRHARVGVPVTLVTLAICAISLWWRASPRPDSPTRGNIRPDRAVCAMFRTPVIPIRIPVSRCHCRTINRQSDRLVIEVCRAT
jgi:hypothetical protein